MPTKPKKKAAAPVPAKITEPADYRVRVRMYRQGLGDCFLLSFRDRNKELRHVMIDCGVVLGTKNPAEPMKKVARSLFDETGGKIDLLVITHEHWDHLSGFSPDQARAELDKITFGELWLAWTEDEKNDLANALRAERALKKAAAAATKKKLAGTGADADRKIRRLDALLGFSGPEAGDGDGGEGEGGTGGALAFLKKKISRRRNLKPGGPPLTLPGVEGVRVYVLGPPEDKSMLHKTNPGKGQGYGLSSGMSLAAAYAAALGESDTDAAHPFATSYRRRLTSLPKDGSYEDPKNAWRRIDHDWLAVGERLALQLDSDTNNTSLVLAFEFVDTGEVLLFVGDAQSGNWLSWDDLKWQLDAPNGARREVNASDLLGRTILYKVGHHGSHNATLREKGLERMTSPALVALMPVDEEVAHNVKGWLHMPLPALRDRLKEKCAGLIVSDRDLVEGTNPGALRVTTNPLYFDYFI